MWIRTDTTIDQDCGTYTNCFSVYTVQCRAVVDNKCEFQLSSSLDDCTFPVRLVNKTQKDEQKNVSDILALCFSVTDSG